MARHLFKCRKMHPNTEFVTCPFNHAHKIAAPELKMHTAQCEDRANFDMYKYCITTAAATHTSAATREPELIYNTSDPVAPNKVQDDDDECWDDLRIPAYNPEEYCASAKIIRKATLKTPSEKKQFYEQEMIRHRQLQCIKQEKEEMESVKSSRSRSRSRSRQPSVTASHSRVRSPVRFKRRSRSRSTSRYRGRHSRSNSRRQSRSSKSSSRSRSRRSRSNSRKSRSVSSTRRLRMKRSRSIDRKKSRSLSSTRERKESRSRSRSIKRSKSRSLSSSRGRRVKRSRSVSIERRKRRSPSPVARRFTAHREPERSVRDRYPPVYDRYVRPDYQPRTNYADLYYQRYAQYGGYYEGAERFAREQRPMRRESREHDDEEHIYRRDFRD